MGFVATGIVVAASVLNVVCYAPQILLLWRSKKCENVSVLTFSLFGVYASLMGTYGVLRGDWGVICTNFMSAVQNGIVIAMCVSYRRRAQPAPGVPISCVGVQTDMNCEDPTP